jgi:hypothetical protein
MINLEIIPEKNSVTALKKLEAKGLIRLLKPTPKAAKTRTKTGAVDYFYRSEAKLGGHCLLAVGKRSTEPTFSYHPGNEDIILINPGKLKYKPLYLVVCYLKPKDFLKAFGKGILKQKYFAAVKLEFNRPKTAVFTILKDTVHCEITVPGKGQHPVFFVAEPSKMKSNKIKSRKYNFILRGGK